jgi:tRNA (guanine10-N2)-methyltransferase
MRLMCWFVHKHLEFHEPELISIADMYGEKLALEPEPELVAKVPAPPSPYRFADFADEDTAVKIGSRSVLLRGVLEVWGEGATYEECVAAVRALPNDKKFSAHAFTVSHCIVGPC